MELISEFQKASESHPEDAGAFFNLGSAHFVEGNLAEAEEALNKALELDADHVDAHYYLGLVRAARGDVGGARKHFDAVVDASPHPMLKRLAAGRAEKFAS